MSLLSIVGFTNVGFHFHSRSFTPIETDMSGQTVLVTGGTGGLGLAAARALGRLGARVLVVGRDEAKLGAAESRGFGEIVGIQADLSSMKQIRELAARLEDTENRIDVLINNVGVLLSERELTAEGIERTLAVDLASHFLLTNLLAPLLVASSPARIINVTSGGMYAERVRPHDLQYEKGDYSGTVAYARAKRGQVILTGEWAERLDGTGVVVHAMHPGWAGTAGLAHSLPTFNRWAKPLLRTPDQGADTIVWLATDPEPSHSSGQLWFDREPAPEHLIERTRESAEDREALWGALVELTGTDLPSSLGLVR